MPTPPPSPFPFAHSNHTASFLFLKHIELFPQLDAFASAVPHTYNVLWMAPFCMADSLFFKWSTQMSSSQRDRLATLPKLEGPPYHSSPFDTVTTIFIELIFHYIYFFFIELVSQNLMVLLICFCRLLLECNLNEGSNLIWLHFCGFFCLFCTCLNSQQLSQCIAHNIHSIC